MKVLHVFTIAITPQAFFDGQFKYLTQNSQEIHFVASPSETLKFCNKNNVKFFPINIAREINILADIKAIKNLYTLIKKEKYDIVIGHTPKGALLGMLAASFCNTKIKIYYRHGLIYTTVTGLKRFLFKSVEKFTSLLADKIVNVSPSLSDLAIKDHLNSKNKQLVLGKGTCGGIDAHNLFNPSKILVSEKNSLKKSFGIKDTDIVIGFCGRICKDKGIEELVDSFDLIASNNKNLDFKLLLVGPYDERQGLSEITKTKIADNKNIITSGNVDKNKLPLFYSLMNLFVFPSYREGFGMVVIEAGAMGIPSLVSKSHGCIDSIIPGVTGEYMESITPNDISKGIVHLLKNPLNISYGQNARKFVIENYDHSVLWPKIADFYNSLR